MSEQSDALNKALRDSGVEVPPPPDDGQLTMPGVALAFLELPRDGRRLEAFAREAGLIARTNGVFRREMIPVTVNPETAGMEALTPERFRTYLESIALTFKWKGGGPNQQPPSRMPCTMKVDTARGTLASDQFVMAQRRLQRINMVRQPVERRDGRIELLPEGYDEESETYTMPNSGVVIDETWDLVKAKTYLMDLHKEFPFADKKPDGTSRGLAIHLAGMLALFASGLQDVNAARMNFVYDANSPGSGKGLLVKLVTIPVTGQCESNVISSNEAEFRKTLDTAALGSAPYLFLDEVEGNVRNKDLNAFITADYWSGRLFNVQRKFSAPKLTLCYFAGNNLSLSADINRRSLVAQLYVEEADVQERPIEQLMDTRFLTKATTRGDILSALWALIRAWDKAQRPKSSLTRRGFETWAGIFGGIVEHAGLGNPLEQPPADQSADTEGDDMLALVKRLSRDLGKDDGSGTIPHYCEYTFEELVETCIELNCFTWIIEGKWRETKIEGHVESRYYETTARCGAILGKMFSGKFGGKVFGVGDGRRVRFGVRGKNRQRRYGVELRQ